MNNIQSMQEKNFQELFNNLAANDVSNKTRKESDSQAMVNFGSWREAD